MFEAFLSFVSFILILDSRISLVFCIDEVIFVFQFIWKACINKPISKFYILRSIQEACMYSKFRVQTSSEHDDRAQWNRQYIETWKSLLIMFENQSFSPIWHVRICFSTAYTSETDNFKPILHRDYYIPSIRNRFPTRISFISSP